MLYCDCVMHFNWISHSRASAIGLNDNVTMGAVVPLLYTDGVVPAVSENQNITFKMNKAVECRPKIITLRESYGTRL